MQNKLTKQISDLSQGLLRLEEAVALDSNLIVQDATIQRFEFCFEMSWKLLQTMVHDMGIVAYGPKNVIREAANASLLDSAEDWLHFAEMRNLASHTYNQESAEKVYAAATEFVPMVKKLLERINQH